MGFMFENLEVYQKAVAFAGDVAWLTELFPRGYYFLVDERVEVCLKTAVHRK